MSSVPAMNRPLLFRLVPKRWREGLYCRFFHRNAASRTELFDSAPLAMAPGCVMRGLVPGDVISGSIAFGGVYEHGLSKHIARRARNGGLFVDVGANMGYFTLLWASASPQNRVVAFEASPRNVRLLGANIDANGFADRVRLVAKAVSESAGSVSFDIGPDNQTGWGGISTGGAATIPSVCLDEELGDERIDVLKIDIEGADTLALAGCDRLLRERRIGHIYFEQHAGRMRQLGIEPGAASAFLKARGYAARPLDSDAGEWEAFPVETP